MTKNEQKYINSLKEENERVKNLLLRFMDAIGKLRNLDDVVNMSLIPLMTEENKKIRAEIKAEAYKEFAKMLNNKGMFPHEINDDYAVGLETVNNLLEELVGD